MRKNISHLLVAGSILTNILGGMTTVSAYDGPTDYPENSASGFIVTMIDVRNNEMSMVLRHNDYWNGVLRGFEFVEGEITDDELNSIYLDEDHNFQTYVKHSMYDPNWQDRDTGEEFTYPMSYMMDLLSKNTDDTLAGVYLFKVSPESASLNLFRTRINYSRCTKSEQYINNEAAICRAEIWGDGIIHYQPYIGWERLSLDDEDLSTSKEIMVYETDRWVSKAVGNNGDDSTAGDEAGTAGDEAGTSDGNTGDDGGSSSSGDNTPEIRYVEKIVEVPVIKEIEVPVVREVVKEVPIEKTVVEKVKVEVPVEKTKVEIREVVKEVPVLSSASPTQVAGVVDGLASADMVVGSPDESTEYESDKSSEVAESDISAKTGEAKDDSLEYVDTEEVAELPMLGKEPQSTDNNASGKIAVILAGIISALALVVLAIVYRRKKRENQIDN
ncbi:hypothetical protein IJ114_00615 [Candidatus Saccharibacteria bacterium]|nr:hypothetical protein [Candidatus Saccharibacteria bacterium]